MLTWLHEASDWRDLTVCFRVEGLNYLPTCFLLPLKLPSSLVSKRWVIQYGDIYHFYKTAANLPRFSGMTTPYKLLSHIDKQRLIRLEQSPPLQDFRFSENISSVTVVRSTWFLDWPLVTRYFKLKMNFVFCLCFVGPLLSPQESVALLTQAGLFDNAFTVASHFNLPKETIFEGLASRYGSTSPSSNLTFENRSHLAKHFFLTSKPSWCHSLEKLLVLFLYFFVS